MLDVTPYLEVKAAPAAVFARARETPNAPRFHVRRGDTWTAVSWAQLADSIARVAATLDELGFEKGDSAAIFGDNSVEWAAAALGVQAAGGAMVPIYGSSTSEQAGYITAHADVRVVFVGSANHLDRLLAAKPACLEHIILLGDFEASPKALRWSAIAERSADWQALEARIEAIDLDAPGLMLYTSGSTGRPKGVPLSHNNVGLNSHGWLECNREDLHEGAVDLLWLPFSHIFGFGEMCLGNTLGFETYLCKPKEAIELLSEVKPTVFMSVPAYWEKLASSARARGEGNDAIAALREITGGRLRFCLSGGAGLKREVKELFHEAGVLIIEGYGLTECSPTLTLNSRAAFRFDTVGKPLSNVEVRLANDGEIEARGPNIFGGYHKSPEASAEAFTSDGWFKTGDLGRFTDDGFLQIIGRKKEILVTAGGKNVPPANIEMRFADDPGIEHVVVYGDGKKYLVAAVWLTEGTQLSVTDIAARIEEVNRELASCETIKRFRVIDEPLTVESGYLTASLKLRRNHIYRAFGAKLEELYD